MAVVHAATNYAYTVGGLKKDRRHRLLTFAELERNRTIPPDTPPWVARLLRLLERIHSARRLLPSDSRDSRHNRRTVHRRVRIDLLAAAAGLQLASTTDSTCYLRWSPRISLNHHACLCGCVSRFSPPAAAITKMYLHMTLSQRKKGRQRLLVRLFTTAGRSETKNETDDERRKKEHYICLS